MPGTSRAETSLQAMPGGGSRLPGIRFETVPTRQPSVLPRMDIPVFVGFSSRGPLHVPVPVEDTAEFSEIFGTDLVLAWDTERGQATNAFLAPTVRTFFQNGGRRCWVVRVADEFKAHTACFPVPGLAVYDGSDLQPAFTAARSPGSWGDALQVASALLSQSFALTSFDLATASIDLTLSKPGELVAGDLLRLNFDQDGWFALFPVARIAVQSSDKAPNPAQARAISLFADKIFWFRPAEAQTPPGSTATLSVFTHIGPLAALNVTVPAELWPSGGDTGAVFDYAGLLDPACQAATDQGSLVKVIFSDDSIFWMLVSSQVASDTQPNLPGVGEFARIGGLGIWQCLTAPDALAFINPQPRLEKLTFELHAQTPDLSGSSRRQRLSGLSFGRSNPLYWAALPDDHQLYTAQAYLTTGDAAYNDPQTNPAFPDSTTTRAVGPHASLWQAASSPRFPLAGMQPDKLFLPLLIPALPSFFASPDEPVGDALTRDGLAVFNAGLFLDSALAGEIGEALLSTADDLRYLRANPRSLRGIYSALSVTEATLISVPDAGHNQWEKGLLDPLPPVQSSLPPERPVWWRFLPCSPRPDNLPRTSQPEWGMFLRCGLRIIPAPVLSATQPDPAGSFTISWTAVPNVTRYVLDESAFPDFRSFHTLYSGPLTGVSIYGYSQGDYYFRVRAEAVAEKDGLVETSDYSNGIGLRIAPGTTFLLWQDELFQSEALQIIQRCLLRLCAARGDQFALLNLPGHYRSASAIDFAETLRSPLSSVLTIQIPDVDSAGTLEDIAVLPLSYGEERSLGFGALYHPWLVVTEDQSSGVRCVPPDGPAAGVIARRSFDRGAWIAPANEKLRGVVGLQPVIQATEWLDIQEAHINLIRDEPQGYLALSANTLSADPDWILINVRRLISLLRRLAQRYGPDFVFEPNSPAFRRHVQREFNRWLGQMLAHGAFAGDTPETSFQVNVMATPQDIDAGRLVIELRVAPSVPMRFILVRLIQSGDQSPLSESSTVVGTIGG